MNQQLLALYDLQGLDVQIAKLNAELAALDGGAELKKKMAAAKAALEAAEKSLREKEAELKDAELNLQSLDERRKKYEKRLYEGNITNPKELSSIEKEIKMLKEQQGKLDEKTLGLYTGVEEAKAKADSLTELIGKIERKLDSTVAAQSDSRQRIEFELVDMNKKREKTVATIEDKALLSKYDFIRNRTKSTAVAKVVNGQCGGCHVAITGFTQRKLVEDKELQACENCARILILERK